MAAFNHCTIDIVRGQVLDIENEGRPGVTPDDYLRMIRGKTAAILRFSAWAGAVVGGASEAVAERLGDVGEAIGMGFQIRDDMLGIWSPAEETGKDAADDIRRRKQSLPILILRDRCGEEDRERISNLYSLEEIGPDGVSEMLQLLEKHNVEALTSAYVDDAHDRAIQALDEVLPNQDQPAARALRLLINQLRDRTF